MNIDTLITKLQEIRDNMGGTRQVVVAMYGKPEMPISIQEIVQWHVNEGYALIILKGDVK